MKRIVLFALSLGFFACDSGTNATSKINENNLQQAEKVAEEAKKFPRIVFEKTEHDFGRIKNGTPQETIFKFTNKGDAPLIITEASSSCGCTVPEKPEKPVLPNETAEIKVKFNGNGKDLVTKSVTINANTEQGTHTLTIKAFVE